MKIILTTILILSMPVLAGNYTPRSNTEANAKAEAKSHSESYSQSRSGSYSEGGNAYSRGGDGGDGGTGYGGSNSLNLSLENDYSNNERTRFSSMNHGQNCVGSACESTSTFYIQGQHDESLGNAIQIGVAIPFTFGKNPTRSAMATEAQHLVNRNLYQTERHQADMAKFCMELHKVVEFTDNALSPELRLRCSGFVHNKDAIRMGGIADHEAHGSKSQVSPH